MDQYLSLVSAIGVLITVVLSGYGIIENYRKRARSDLEADYSRVKQERDELRTEIIKIKQQLDFYKDILARRTEIDVEGDLVRGNKVMDDEIKGDKVGGQKIDGT